MSVNEMTKRFWDRVALSYDEEIFDSLANDRKQVIPPHVDRLASKDATACDFGCGVGKYLPLLADCFRAVHAIDISGNCLRFAQQNCGHLDNITFLQADLAKGTVEIEPVHFAISVNVAIMRSRDKRMGILKSIAEHLLPGGHVLLVLPSLESALYADSRLVQWASKEGWTRGRTSRARFNSRVTRNVSIPRGILNLDGAPTKHYLREELIVLLEGLGLQVVAVDKVEYSWKTEFPKPPRWMKRPYPWDWLFVAQKPL